MTPDITDALLERLKQLPQFRTNLMPANAMANVGQTLSNAATAQQPVPAAVAPAQAAPVMADSSTTQALAAQLKQLLAPAPPPTGLQAVTGALAQFGRVGFQDPLKAQQMEMERTQLGQQNLSDRAKMVMEQLKNAQEQDYRQGSLSETSRLRKIEEDKAARDATQAALMNPIQLRTATANATEAEKKANAPETQKLGPDEAIFQRNKDTGTWEPQVTTPPKPKAPEPVVENGIPVAIKTEKQTFGIDDPNMPPELTTLRDQMLSGHKQRLQEQADIADRLNARQEARAEAAAARNAQIQAMAPDPQVKNIVTAGYLTKDAATSVKELMAAYPDLVGPALGRAEQSAQGLGTSFGLQDPAREKAAANLSKNFADLIINEARVASPGRTNKELLDIVKASSAKMSQDPSIIDGFITGALQSADRGITAGKRWGIDLDKKTNTPAAPNTKSLRDKYKY